VTGSISDIGSDTEKDVDLTLPSEKAAVCSPVKCDTPAVTADDNDGNPSDDDDDDNGSDATSSISGVGLGVGRLSDVEENVPDTQNQSAVFINDNVSALSPRSIRRLLTKHSGSVGDVQSEACLAGEF